MTKAPAQRSLNLIYVKTISDDGDCSDAYVPYHGDVHDSTHDHHRHDDDRDSTHAHRHHGDVRDSTHALRHHDDVRDSSSDVRDLQMGSDRLHEHDRV